MERITVSTNISAPIEKKKITLGILDKSRTYCELELCGRRMALS